MRRMALVAVALVVALFGTIVPATSAEASTRVLCVGYNACAKAGYTDHGYKEKRHNLFWRMAGDHNCTNYVAYLLVKKGMVNVRPWDGDGNAYAWGDFTKDIRDSTPVVGAVAWWDKNRAPASATGHVSYVERVISKNEIIVSEDNWKGEFRWKRITKSGGGWPSAFIHLKDSRTPKTPAYVATLASQKVWTSSAKTAEATSATMNPGSTAWVELKYKNTGRKTWTAATLGTQAPAERASELASGWISPSTVVKQSPKSVAPGKVATFSFAVTIPDDAAVGTLWAEQFAPRSKTGVWMPQADAGLLFGADSRTPQTLTPIPTVAAKAKEGVPLTAVTGTWDEGVALTYLWKRNGVAIARATAATYTPTSADVGIRLTVTVSGGREGFLPSVQTSKRTGLVASVLSDRIVVGDPLSAGEQVISANGVYSLTQRADGNLVIYDRRTQIPIWANAVEGPKSVTKLLKTGALNTYISGGNRKWTAGATKSKAVAAVLGNDGRLVLVTKKGTKVWSSYTSGR